METLKEHRKMERVLEHNSELLAENNKLLKKMHRWNVVGFWVRLVWYILLIGLPFAIYFYLLEPYFEALGSSYETFQAGVGELPGIKSLDILLNQGE